MKNFVKQLMETHRFSLADIEKLRELVESLDDSKGDEEFDRIFTPSFVLQILVLIQELRELRHEIANVQQREKYLWRLLRSAAQELSTHSKVLSRITNAEELYHGSQTKTP